MKKNELWKKSLGILVCTAMLATAFTGCGNKDAEKPGESAAGSTPAAQESEQEAEALADEAPAEADVSGKVTVWTWTAEQLAESIVPAFNEKYPDVAVELVNLPSGDLKTKLLASLAAGSGGPDVCQIQLDDAAQYIENGGLADISGYMNAVKDDFPAFQIAALSDGAAIYGTPIDAGPCGLFYRADLFEAAGIEVPTTIDEFFAAGEALKANGVYLHRQPASGDVELLRMMIQQQGGSYFDADGNPTLNTDAVRNAVEFQKKLYESGYGMDVRNWSPAYDAEIQGEQLASHMGAAWYMNNFINSWSEACEDWRIAPMPQFKEGDNASCNNGGSAMAIPEQSENKDAAWAFIEFYCASTEGRSIASQNMGEFSAYLPAFDDPTIKDSTVKYFGDQKVYSFFAEELPKVPTDFLQPPAFAEVHGVLGADLGKVIVGEMSVDDYLASVQEAAEAVVAKY